MNSVKGKPARILWFKSMLPNAVRDGSSMASLNLANAVSRNFDIDLVSCHLRGNESVVAQTLLPTFSTIKLIKPEGYHGLPQRIITRLKYEFLAKLRQLPRASFYESSGPIKEYLQGELNKNKHAMLHLEYWTTGRLLDLDTDLPRVLYLHDATWIALEQKAGQTSNSRTASAILRTAQLVKKAEIEAAKKADHVHFLSQTDMRQFQAEGISNGVYIPILMPALVRKKRSLIKPNILFLGRLEHYPNVDALDWFLRDVFPIIKRSIPDTTITIVGPNAPANIKQHLSKPDIIYLGWVDNIENVLDNTSVAIAPIRIGTGTKLKILELMWHGLPMVVTRNAAAGTPAESGGALVADTSEIFAEQTITLLNDGNLRQQIRDKAWDLMEMSHCGEDANSRVLAIFEKIAAK